MATINTKEHEENEREARKALTLRTHLENITKEVDALNSRDDTASTALVFASYDTSRHTMDLSIVFAEHKYFGNVEFAIELDCEKGLYRAYPAHRPILVQLKNEKTIFHPLFWTTETLKKSLAAYARCSKRRTRDTVAKYSKSRNKLDWDHECDSITSYYVNSIIDMMMDLDTYDWHWMRSVFHCSCCPNNERVIKEIDDTCKENTPFMVCEKEGFDAYKQLLKINLLLYLFFYLRRIARHSLQKHNATLKPQTTCAQRLSVSRAADAACVCAEHSRRRARAVFLSLPDCLLALFFENKRHS